MYTKLDGGKLTIGLEGRIDSNNAAQFEQELFAALDAAPEATPVLDAEKLDYISSAGLRVLMKLRKRVNQKVPILNVSPEVWDILDVTGFSELLEVYKKLREISVDGCEKLGEGANGAVYRLDEDKIVKVYKPWMEQTAIDRERGFARTAFVNGIPSVIAYDTVRVGNCFGVVFELLRSDTLGHAMRDNPEKLEAYVDQYVALAKVLHSTHIPADGFTRIQELAHRLAENLGRWCSTEEIALLHRIIDAIPEADTVIHNDLHPGNIMIQDGELVLIDMSEVTIGPPIIDLMSIYRGMIVAPQRQPELMVQTIGMPVDMIQKAGNLFFMKYTGITDGAEMEAYYKKLSLLYAFNVTLMLGTGMELSAKIADSVMTHLFRPIVIPNEQAIRNLLQTM